MVHPQAELRAEAAAARGFLAMSLEQLRRKCVEFQLSAEGSKMDMVERLVGYLYAEDPAEDWTKVGVRAQIDTLIDKPGRQAIHSATRRGGGYDLGGIANSEPNPFVGLKVAASSPRGGSATTTASPSKQRLQAADGATVLNVHVRDAQGVRKPGFGGSSPQRPDVALNGMTLLPGHRRNLEVACASATATEDVADSRSRTGKSGTTKRLGSELESARVPEPEPEPEGSLVRELHARMKALEQELSDLKSQDRQEVESAERVAELEERLEQATVQSEAKLEEQDRLHSQAMQSMQAELQKAKAQCESERAQNDAMKEQLRSLYLSQELALNQAEDAVSTRDAAVEQLALIVNSQRKAEQHRDKALQLAGVALKANGLVHTGAVPAQGTQSAADKTAEEAAAEAEWLQQQTEVLTMQQQLLEQQQQVQQPHDTPNYPYGVTRRVVRPVSTGPVEHSVSRKIVEEAHAGDIGVRLKKAGARVGKLTCSLIWNNADDLELHCLSPTGDHIHWNQITGHCGGHLDVDMHATGITKNELVVPPVENMYWDNPPPGKYKFYVQKRTTRKDPDEPRNPGFTVRLTKDAKAQDKDFDDLADYETQTVFEFEL